MIRAAWRRLVRFLGSAIFATSLLAAVAFWSMLGSLLPQGAATTSVVKAWAAAHPAVEPVVDFFSLHQAYGAPIFLVCILALALSTALCAWQRTKAAAAKARQLRTARTAGHASVAAKHDLEIPCGASADRETVLGTAADTLAELGIKTRRTDGALVSASSTWSVWGSPVFHWALLALTLSLMAGNLLRADGLMGLTLGQTKADAPASYGLINTGPLHDWSRVQRSLRLDDFELDYTTGGINRGPTPTVSLLDGHGAVITTQKVYPNHTLKSGSLTVYPSDYGLSATFSLVSTSGASQGSIAMLMDFATDTTVGTSPIDSLDISNTSGALLYQAFVTVPLDKAGGAFVERVPAAPQARLTFAEIGGAGKLVHDMKVGDTIAFPTGEHLRLDGVGYYARLSVVDDWSIPLLFVALIAALLGLTVAVIVRQQIVLVTVIEGEDGVSLAVTMRLWRNSSSSRSEIESELRQALNPSNETSTT